MLKLSQTMKLSQKLDVRMIQSLKLLPLTTLQLEQRINEELELNPMLQMEEVVKLEEEKLAKSADDSGKVETDTQETSNEGDFTEAEWMKYMDDGYDSNYVARQEYDPNFEERESTQTYSYSLSEYLLEQLGVMAKDELEREIGEFIIGCINDDGFLELSAEEIANDMSLPVEDIQHVIEIIQQMDPPGVGSHTLRECLLLQLKERELVGSVAWRILEKHYEDFTQRKFKDIILSLSIEEDDIRSAMDVISVLTSRPGSIYKDDSNTSIIPDIVVEKVDGEYEVILNDYNTPHLSISASYRKLLNKGAKTERETRKYLVDKLNSARWFINSIEQRRSTILRVANSIVDNQYDFLEHGVSHLRPMKLQDIADTIGVAISTVQRVTVGKYMQTPQGIFELKYFFTQRISSSNGSDDFSSKSVKDKLKKLIESEDPNKPLSDQKITNILNEEGIDISRRAIAKYRDELQLPPARLRKQF